MHTLSHKKAILVLLYLFVIISSTLSMGMPETVISRYFLTQLAVYRLSGAILSMSWTISTSHYSTSYYLSSNKYHNEFKWDELAQTNILYSRTLLIQTSITQICRLTKHQIYAAMPIKIMLLTHLFSSVHVVLSDHYLFVSYANRATKWRMSISLTCWHW